MTEGFEAKSEAFWQWLLERGAKISPKIELVDYRSRNEGRAVVASNDIEDGEVLFKIPQQLVLSPASSDLNSLIPEELLKLDVWPALILTMMYESKRPSWKPYLDILPSESDSLIYWTKNELAELEGSAVVNKIGRSEIEAMYKSILLPIIEAHQTIFARVDTSFEAFQALGSIIMAYSFDLEKPKVSYEMDVDDKSDISDAESEDEEAHYFKAMVALADMLNADANLNNADETGLQKCRLHYHPPNDVEMLAIKSIKKGEELYNDYGPLPRSDLLRRYGYITDNYEQYDVVEIGSDLIVQVVAADLERDDLDERIEYLLDEGVLEDSVDIEYLGQIPDELRIILQILSVPRTLFESLKVTEKTPKHKKDSKAKDYILEIVRRREVMYLTTVEDDINLLSGSDLSHRKRMAIKVRLGEKQILRKMAQAVGDWTSEEGLQNGTKKRKPESKDSRNGNGGAAPLVAKRSRAN